MKIKYSFIIPVKEINDYIRESIPKILEIDRSDYEIIIYPDFVDSNFKVKKVQQIATGEVGPAKKRSLAIRDAKGEILIFIDDDAYPKASLLDILDKSFNNSEIVAVGGPAITPKDDSFWQKVSGAVFLSSLSGGNPNRYIPIGKISEIDDWPSVNFSVRKEDFVKVNGFNSEYWPGEDTILCLDLKNKVGKKIIYDPNLIVFHHRRSGLLKHLKQIGQYGIHRGFFAKKFPQTSFKLKYFIPSFFLIYNIFFLIFLFFSLFLGTFNLNLLRLFLIGYIVYFFALIKAFFDIYKFEKNILICLHATYYIFFTHLFYGYKFLKGFLFTKELKSKLRKKT